MQFLHGPVIRQQLLRRATLFLPTVMLGLLPC
ncbi:Uncharacterised protein [Segatella copri]|nr:Uncharacterised protein [Segatella copri]